MGRLGVMLSAAALLASAIGCQTDVQSGIDRGKDLLYEKQYVASDRLFRKLLKRLENRGELDDDEDAQRLTILDQLGKINALYLHDYGQAIAYYQTLVRHYPKTDQAFAARATVADIYHHKLGDLQAAIDAYQKLVSEFPNRNEAVRAQLKIANAYFQLRNYEQARTEAEHLIERWPESKEATQARFQIANSYYVQGRYAEAIATYNHLLDDEPEPSVAALVLFELGNCFQGLDQPEQALAYFYACLKDHPDPMLVQRKIQRVRNRMHKTRPLPEVYLPEYLQQRLNAARHPGTLTRSAVRNSDAPAPARKPPSHGGAAPEQTNDVAKPAPKPKPKPEPKPTAGGGPTASAPAQKAPPAEPPAKAPPAKAPPPDPEPAGEAPAP
jgi:tetratricopeptide (TPR) repeat protein